MIECSEPGIYFNFPEDEYHKIPALGSTNLKDLLCNPVVFWANSWMNPHKEESDSTEAKIIGSAYHKRILEGRDAFYAEYGVDFDKDDHPDALGSSDEVKDALREMKAAGHDVKLTGNKPFLIEQLLQCDPQVQIIDILKQQFYEENEGKVFLSQRQIDHIEYAAAMIEKHPELRRCFVGGYPEVTIVWEHPDHKHVMMKARIDYLKTRAFIDLKTFQNQQGKPTDRAIYGAMSSYKYHIQAAHYYDGVMQAIKFAKEGKVFGQCDKKWIKSFSEASDSDMYYVFQQKGQAPLARGKRFPKGSIYQCACVAIDQALDLYRENLERFGSDQWVDMSPITEFYDDEFPVYITEI